MLWLPVKEISSMDFPQHGEVFYFPGQALLKIVKSEFFLKTIVYTLFF
jgi:hypothetical protein